MQNVRGQSSDTIFSNTTRYVMPWYPSLKYKLANLKKIQNKFVDVSKDVCLRFLDLHNKIQNT
jgi:hypothetical protein